MQEESQGNRNQTGRQKAEGTEETIADRREYNRRRYAINRKETIRRRRELKTSLLSQEELKQYQDDPFKEERLHEATFVVCRECGAKPQNLISHVRKHNKMSIDEYKTKWPAAPVFAPSFRKKMQTLKKNWGDQHGGNYFGGKRHQLLPGERWRKEDKPPTPDMRRSWARRGDKQRGRRTPKQAIDDAAVIDYKLAGKTNNGIAAEGGITNKAIMIRLHRLGCPATACGFIHGEPFAKSHFEDICQDFGVSMKTVSDAIKQNSALASDEEDRSYFGGQRRSQGGKFPKTYYNCLANQLERRKSPDVLLSARFACSAIDVRKRWTEAYCFDLKLTGGKRARNFLISEIGDGRSRNRLSDLRDLLRKPLIALRHWLQEKTGNVEPNTILNWICDQSRNETSQISQHRGVSLGFRKLMLLWPLVKDLREKKSELLPGHRHIDEVVDELLASDYNATPNRIRLAASGQLMPLDPTTLGKIIRHELVSRKHRIPGRKRESEEEKSYYKIGHSVEKEIPNDLKQDRYSIVAARRLISQNSLLSYDLVAEYHKEFRQFFRRSRIRIPD